ncbi:MAG: SPOR domain-containing protein, partial [Rhodobacteraceae bacterium]|nr:SPOR domain-containing protein [Paracoccaceae bacterium]
TVMIFAIDAGFIGVSASLLKSTFPVSTKIWVQVGAFYAETSANTVFAKLKGVGNGDVSAVNQQGKTLYRVRLGPVDNVEMADDLLEKVINTGFAGARIVVD